MSGSSTQSTVLRGHSGALVTVETAGSLRFVRKRSPNPTASVRLRAQAERQTQAQALGLPCPKVLAQGEIDDCFYFDMEYIPSISVSQMLIDSVPFNRDELALFLDRVVQAYAVQSTGLLTAESFSQKFRQIYARCQANDVLSDVVPAIERIVETLLERDWTGVPTGPCHGDLTLENILYSRERGFLLIDFDKVDLSSHWLDIAKIFQDLWGHWCLRDMAVTSAARIEHLNASLNVSGMQGLMMRTLRPHLGTGRPQLMQMVVFHLLRVLPYCTDRAIAIFVIMRINHMLSEFEMNRQS